MNAVKRTARRRYYRKMYGPMGGLDLADNRSFRRTKPSPKGEPPEAPLVGLVRREKMLFQLDKDKWDQREKQIDYIHEHINDSRVRNGQYMGWHGNLWNLTFGELDRRYHMLKALLEAA